ncbi:MAG: hypothetical protein Q9219_002680 [cf. Caloplaca sp. 3 TL-2023]
MDHIPLPHSCSYPPVEVPYLDKSPDDYGSWYTYPQRHGWQVDYNRSSTVLLLHGAKRPAVENAMFIQSWLYFGLLREFLGDIVRRYQFNCHGVDGKRKLSSKSLETVLRTWTNQFSTNIDPSEAVQSLKNLYTLLLEHRTICLKLYVLGPDLESFSIFFSIAVLSERLMAAIIDLHRYHGLETPVEQTWRIRENGFPNMGQPILTLMRTRGWCPYDLQRLDLEAKEVSVLYYYSNLNPPRSSKDHSRCSEESCLAMLTNLSNYKLSHRRENCGCALLYSDQRQVAKILRSGSIPLISIFSNGSLTNPKILVQDFTHDRDFVAISHVWAEGAGNVHENALQTCLLEDLSDLVRKLPWNEGQHDFPFWIDTLCVPVRPLELQTIALNKMRTPYERARHVLVLDSHLRSLHSRLLSPTEIFAQVSCSSWMRRLWTLQEGRLAQKVWFQFADEAVDVQSVFTKFVRPCSSPGIDYFICTGIYVRLWMQVWHSADQIRKTSKVASLLSSINLSLASRSVSVPTDEALCLFTLMGMDLTQVTSVPLARRMEVFWRTFDRVPQSILFSKAPNKMPVTGLHWAPSSCLGFQSDKEWLGPQTLNSPREDQLHAVLRDDGLLVTFPGVILHQGLVKRMKVFDFTWKYDLLVQDGHGVWYAMRLEEPWRSESAIMDGSQPLAVILAHGLKVADSAPSESRPSYNPYSFQDQSVGVLVSIKKIESDLVYVTAHNHVSLELLGEGTQRCLSLAHTCATTVNVAHSILSRESHTLSKKRYMTVAKKLLEDMIVLEVLAGQAQHLGEECNYEDLLDSLLDTTVVTARMGECSYVEKTADSKQWCVD